MNRPARVSQFGRPLVLFLGILMNDWERCAMTTPNNPPAPGPDADPEMNDEEFIAIRNCKIGEAAANPEHIFTAAPRLLFADGYLSFNPIRFDPFTPEQVEHCRANVDLNDCADGWLKEFWTARPGASIADAMRERLGVGAPEEEAGFMMAAAGDDASARAILAPVNSTRKTWAEYLRLRGWDFLGEKFKIAFEMDAVIFAALCKATVDELKSLTTLNEIGALQSVQKIMLETLRREGRYPEIEDEARRRVREAIVALAGVLGKDAPEQDGNPDDEQDERAIRLQDCCLQTVIRVEDEIRKGLFDDPLRSYWPALGDPWAETVAPWKDEELQAIIDGVLIGDVDLALRWITAKCDGSVVVGASEKLAWKRVLQAALAVLRDWEANTAKWSAENRELEMMCRRAGEGPEPEPIPTDWRPEIRETIAALERALGGGAPASGEATLAKIRIPITGFLNPIHPTYRDATGNEWSHPDLEAEHEARERYDPIIDRMMDALGLSSAWTEPIQQRAKILLATNALDIHKVTKIERIPFAGDPSETYYLNLTLDFWQHGFFEHDPERYIRKLRIAPPELEQIPGLRSWLKTRWMELYPDQAIPDVLKESTRHLASSIDMPKSKANETIGTKAQTPLQTTVQGEEDIAKPSNGLPDDETLLEEMESWLSEKERMPKDFKGALRLFITAHYPQCQTGYIDTTYFRLKQRFKTPDWEEMKKKARSNRKTNSNPFKS